jgi:hypothetical protein
MIRSILAVIVGLALSNCGSTPVTLPTLEPSAEAQKTLNQKIYSQLAGLKISEPAEISSVHRNEALGTPAEWAICLRNNSGKGINYYVFLIDQNEIVDSRRAIILDRCSEQSYMPLAKPPSPKSIAPAKR